MEILPRVRISNVCTFYILLIERDRALCPFKSVLEKFLRGFYGGYVVGMGVMRLDISFDFARFN